MNSLKITQVDVNYFVDQYLEKEIKSEIDKLRFDITVGYSVSECLSRVLQEFPMHALFLEAKIACDNDTQTSINQLYNLLNSSLPWLSSNTPHPGSETQVSSDKSPSP